MKISAYQEMIDKGDLKSLKDSLLSLSPPDLAEIIQKFPIEQSSILFRLMPRETSALVFEYLPIEEQTELVRSLASEQLVTLLNSMSPDDRTRLLEELPPEITKQALSILTPEELKIARQLLGYPEGSAGRWMTPEYITISPEMTTKEVLARVREYGQDTEALEVLYVTDNKGKLINSVRLATVVVAKEQTEIAQLIEGQPLISISAMADRSEFVKLFEKYDRFALPVTDSEGYLLGVITVDDALDVVEEEATENIQRIGGMEALHGPYLRSTFKDMLTKRVSWLLILFLGEMFTSTAMQHFSDQIAKIVALSIFIPLIISSGGNAGSQAASLIIRSLATKEVELVDWKRVFKRELLSGLALGTCLGLLGFIRVVTFSWFGLSSYGPHYMAIGIIIFFSLIGIVLLGTLVGSMLPMLLKRLRIDPATASAPFVATLVDVSGIVIYFKIASVLLKNQL